MCNSQATFGFSNYHSQTYHSFLSFSAVIYSHGYIWSAHFTENVRKDMDCLKFSKIMLLRIKHKIWFDAAFSSSVLLVRSFVCCCYCCCSSCCSSCCYSYCCCCCKNGKKCQGKWFYYSVPVTPRFPTFL